MSRQARTATLPMDTAIEITGLTKTFGQWQRSNEARDILRNLLKPQKRTVTALDDVSFRVGRGEFVAYAGPNGAGKSTTMKLMAGMLRPGKGTLSVLGMDPGRDRANLMRRVGLMFGNRTELWWDHPVLQSFQWKRVVWDIPRDRYEHMLKLVTGLLDLEDILHTFARELSLGQRMKADLAMMLLHEPELILLDEPTIGLDVLAKRQMIAFLKELNREKGTTIVVTSHDMDDLEEMARRILLISRGKIAFDGSFGELREATGGISRLLLRCPAGVGEAPGLPHARFLRGGEGEYEYEYKGTEISVAQLLSQVAALEGVEDVEIRKAPIEEVIAGLYRQWR